MKSNVMTAAILFVGAMVAFSAENKNSSAARRNTRYYFDLGPSQIDVSAYPKIQQKNYALFAQTCSRCHTLARPINAPIVTEKGWRRYLRRMHAYSKNSPVKLTQPEINSILSFLVYDAKIRKVGQRKQFLAQTAVLKVKFAQFKKQHLLLEQKKNAKEVGRSYFYSGPSPQP